MGCRAPGDCLLCLAASLPKSLVKLALDMRSCLVGSEGFAALTAAFGPNLGEVTLDFRECTLLTAVRQQCIGSLLAKGLLQSSTLRWAE